MYRIAGSSSKSFEFGVGPRRSKDRQGLAGSG
jgi:hypothetical protein